MHDRCADECLFWWDVVQRAALSPWERQFASQIASKAEKPWWRPTDKQLRIMRRMVDQVFYGPGSELIEEERPIGRSNQKGGADIDAA